MKCPDCQSDNPPQAKFCNQCGRKLEAACPNCGHTNPPQAKFCNECGHGLEAAPDTPERALIGESERKHVTALFADMSGYTAMSEKLDPEEVKDITSQLFDAISKVVAKYDGFIEKYVGDAVLALFGVPRSHEDDPVRAIKAAQEIDRLVQRLSPNWEPRIGRPLVMHSGVNTGLVVTGEVNLEKGTHGVAGDAINVAARLSSLAQAGEIIVGPDTFRQAEAFFSFESLTPTKVKGKAEPIRIYKVLSAQEQPGAARRFSGLRAEFVGREGELDQLEAAAEDLRQGQGAVVSICGEAGVGKTRLVQEIKSSLDGHEFQWLEGQAYAYAQNTPYFPLMDLLSSALTIDERDLPEQVKDKIESGLKPLVGPNENVIPYVASLYNVSYPGVGEVSPEIWKARLREAVQAILGALAHKGPTIVCLEDLHWADPSTIELLRFLVMEFRPPVLFICVYRPHFSLLASHQLSGLSVPYRELKIENLTAPQTQAMVVSLLKTKTIPPGLLNFIQEKVEGNPFYVEEMVSALIESGALASEDEGWRLTREISEADMPASIHGVITARLDRLDHESKRILQEASVIGRAFLYDILRRCTDLQAYLDKCLSALERLSLIQTRAIQPELEYVFKQALTQEVVYNGLLKKERQAIHERIGLVMEELFSDRLNEFCETLAFHFQRGRSLAKAVDYLVRAGEKSVNRYAVEESHNYFKQAFDLLKTQAHRSDAEDNLLIEVLVRWSLVFYYRGDFKTLIDLLAAHEELAQSQKDKALLGMYWAWYGFALYFRSQPRRSYEYLKKGLKLGEELAEERIIGYACSWLAWTCADLGLFDEAVASGERALGIAAAMPEDQYLYFKAEAAIGFACSLKGERERADQAGRRILEFGQRRGNARSMALGYWIMGFNHFQDGDLEKSMECNRQALEASVDPYYNTFSELILGMACALEGQLKEGQERLKKVEAFSEAFGCEVLQVPATATLGLCLMALGSMSQGLAMTENELRVLAEAGRKPVYASFECSLGQVYLQVVDKTAPISLGSMVRNLGFILKQVPGADKKAEAHFQKAAETAREIGSWGLLGRASLLLGLLHRAKNRKEQARQHLQEAIALLGRCHSRAHLVQAQEALAALG